MATEEANKVIRTDGQIISGKIKAWNIAKGYGFATADDGGEDIFMHQSVIQVEDDKFRCAAPGTVVEITYFDRNGKHTASKVTAVGGAAFKGFSSKSEAQNACMGVAGGSLGKVKWYNMEKGFGFIIPDQGGDKDVFFIIKDVEGGQILKADDLVSYMLEEDSEGKSKACKIKSLAAPAPSAGQYGGVPQLGPYGYRAPPPASPAYSPYPQYPPQMYPNQSLLGGGAMGGAIGGGAAGGGVVGGYTIPGGSLGDVKVGTCKWYNVTKAFGFILPSEGGKDLYFRNVNPPPKEGDSLEYELRVVDGKSEGINVTKPENRKRKLMEQQPYDPYAPQAKVQRGPASYPPVPPSGQAAPGQTMYDPYNANPLHPQSSYPPQQPYLPHPQHTATPYVQDLNAVPMQQPPNMQQPAYAYGYY